MNAGETGAESIVEPSRNTRRDRKKLLGQSNSLYYTASLVVVAALGLLTVSGVAILTELLP